MNERIVLKVRGGRDSGCRDLFSLTLDLIPGQAAMARGQVRRGGNPLKGQSLVMSDSGEGLVMVDEGAALERSDFAVRRLPLIFAWK